MTKDINHQHHRKIIFLFTFTYLLDLYSFTNFWLKPCRCIIHVSIRNVLDRRCSMSMMFDFHVWHLTIHMTFSYQSISRTCLTEQLVVCCARFVCILTAILCLHLIEVLFNTEPNRWPIEQQHVGKQERAWLHIIF
jgi:hypothetical protein